MKSFKKTKKRVKIAATAAAGIAVVTGVLAIVCKNAVKRKNKERFNVRTTPFVEDYEFGGDML